MSQEIIMALMSGSATLIVCLINNYFALKQANLRHEEVLRETNAKYDESINMIKYQIDELIKKQEKYNNVIERTYELEKKSSVCGEKIAVINHRIQDLEDIGKSKGDVEK